MRLTLHLSHGRRHGLLSRRVELQAPGMFVVDEETAAAIRHAWEAGDELAGVVEPRRHFPSGL